MSIAQNIKAETARYLVEKHAGPGGDDEFTYDQALAACHSAADDGAFADAESLPHADSGVIAALGDKVYGEKHSGGGGKYWRSDRHDDKVGSTSDDDKDESTSDDGKSSSDKSTLNRTTTTGSSKSTPDTGSGSKK